METRIKTVLHNNPYHLHYFFFFFFEKESQWTDCLKKEDAETGFGQFKFWPKGLLDKV